MELQPKANGNYLHIALFSLLQLLLLPQPAQLQHYYPHAQPHRPLYYDAAPAQRLRRWEYVPASYVGGYVAPPAAHYQQHTPHFQLINYRPNYQPLALEYVQQHPPAPAPAPAAAPAPAPAPPLPSLYPQPSVQYQQRSIAPHAELAKYRYEGNYIPVQQRTPVAPPLPPLPQRRLVEEQLYNVPPALFTSDVLHVVPARSTLVQHDPQPERPRRFAGKQATATDAVAAETKTRRGRAVNKEETKYFHDILMRFDGPHARSQGHVLEHPDAQERRFETQRGTNRYKGEIIWTDRRGGHGEHRWDMAQGKL